MERTVEHWLELANYFDYNDTHFADYIRAEVNRRTIGIVPNEAFRDAVLERERKTAYNTPLPNTFEHNYERFLGDS